MAQRSLGTIESARFTIVRDHPIDVERRGDLPADVEQGVELVRLALGQKQVGVAQSDRRLANDLLEEVSDRPR